MLVHTRVLGHLDVPLAVAWPFVSDFKVLPMWHVGVAGARDVDGAMDEVGSTAVLVLKLFDGLHDFEAEITAVEPLRRTVQVGRQVDGPMRYTTTVSYTPAAEGYDCVWEQDTEFPDNIPGPMGSEPFLERFTEQMLRHSLENVKLFMEAMVPQPV